VKLCGFDINASAVEDAVVNAKLNGVENVAFTVSDASKFKSPDSPTVIFADPPRAGCDKAFLDFVVRCSPERFVYVSCNPETLARDLGYISKYYKVRKIQPVDMFPGTSHVESVVCLTRLLDNELRERMN
jgi:23S rRNA (uracil1939-C5)-methyltransferase